MEQPKDAPLPFNSLHNDRNLTDAVIKQQIETLLIAGYETSAMTISFSILMLAMHSSVQEQVFKELHSIYDTQHGETTHQHMTELDILDRVIKETMRLFPPASMIGRTSAADFSLSNCIIPKGATIAMSIFTLHRVRLSLNCIENGFLLLHLLETIFFCIFRGEIFGAMMLIRSIQIAFYRKM